MYETLLHQILLALLVSFDAILKPADAIFFVAASSALKPCQIAKIGAEDIGNDL